MAETENSKPFICPSTRKFFQEWRARRYLSLWDFIHGYIYGRWPYLYIAVGQGRHPAAKTLGFIFQLVSRLWPKSEAGAPGLANGRKTKTTFADGYHGKVMPLDQAGKLVRVNQAINLADLEQVIPYQRARSLILKNPDHIVALNCPCRAAQDNPCQPEDVCLVIGEPFAGFIIEHHPDKARWVSRQEALSIMAAEAARGHVHHAFFKDAMLDRFYAICNCCSCCCGAITAHRNGIPMLAPSGYVAEVDQGLCLGCGNCAGFCQFEALETVNGGVAVNFEKCMGCGVCEAKCEQGAIGLRLEPAKGVPLDIRNLQENRPG